MFVFAGFHHNSNKCKYPGDIWDGTIMADVSEEDKRTIFYLAWCNDSFVVRKWTNENLTPCTGNLTLTLLCSVWFCVRFVSIWDVLYWISHVLCVCLRCPLQLTSPPSHFLFWYVAVRTSSGKNQNLQRVLSSNFCQVPERLQRADRFHCG